MVMIGSGKIGPQPIEGKAVLPAPVVIAAPVPEPYTSSKADNLVAAASASASATPSDLDVNTGLKQPSSASNLVAPVLSMAVGFVSSLIWM